MFETLEDVDEELAEVVGDEVDIAPVVEAVLLRLETVELADEEADKEVDEEAGEEAVEDARLLEVDDVVTPPTEDDGDAVRVVLVIPATPEELMLEVLLIPTTELALPTVAELDVATAGELDIIVGIDTAVLVIERLDTPWSVFEEKVVAVVVVELP
ncbi:uncharacterized protein PG986_009045 [Apiospora aurea]|uniref:Uncharacterized protein n=1 Tax=Apiospora aurea TaxID=335848 RepID=A0ABR1Q6L3_9PEZI